MTDHTMDKENGTNVVLDEAVAPSWKDQDALLRTLWYENKSPDAIAEHLKRSVAAVMTRAARLGLPRRLAPGRKRGYKRSDTPRTARQSGASLRCLRRPVEAQQEEKECAPKPSDAGPRVCLMCLKKFQSQGRHNRICPACKGSADYMTGSATPDFAFQGGK